MSNPVQDPSSASQETARPTSAATDLVGSKRRRNIVVASIIVLTLAVLGVMTWQIHRMHKDVAGLQWANALHERDDDNEITTDVGTIQFLKKGGYSISFDSAKYTADGLYLHGVIGNPTWLIVSNLSLKFTATKPLYQYADDYDKDPFVMLAGPPAIGEAQTSPIERLGSATTQPFEVTIPNVKQTKEGIRLVVSFSGERYNY